MPSPKHLSIRQREALARRAVRKKRLQAEQLYEKLLWLHEVADRRGIPFRALLAQIIVLGARRMGFKPPTIESALPPSPEWMPDGPQHQPPV